MDIDMKTASGNRLAAERQRQATLSSLFASIGGGKTHINNVAKIDAEFARRDRLLAAMPGLVEACKIALSTISPKIDNSDAMGWGVSAEAHLDAALAAHRAAEGGA